MPDVPEGGSASFTLIVINAGGPEFVCRPGTSLDEL